MTVFGYASDTLDIFAIADGLERAGLAGVPRRVPVPAIRFMQSPVTSRVDPYLADLREVAELVRTGQLTSDGGRAQYT